MIFFPSEFGKLGDNNNAWTHFCFVSYLIKKKVVGLVYNFETKYCNPIVLITWREVLCEILVGKMCVRKRNFVRASNFYSHLTHRGRVTHICVSGLGQCVEQKSFIEHTSFQRVHCVIMIATLALACQNNIVTLFSRWRNYDGIIATRNTFTLN